MSLSLNNDNLPNLHNNDLKLLKKISSCGMESVYEAELISLSRRVVVKVMPPHIFGDDMQRTLFLNESKHIVKLCHPNIIKIIDAKKSGEYCYYVMEFIDGISLDKVQAPGIKTTAMLGIQAAQAIAYAHNCGILHKNIKPCNFLLDADGCLHLGNFSFSNLQSPQGQYVTKISDGTLSYIAPEQLLNNEYFAQSDIYALGVMLYELSFNHPLYPYSTIEELKENICNVTPFFPCSAPHGFAAILKKCLHKDPLQRYQSAADVANDLKRFLNDDVVSAEQFSCFYRCVLWGKRKMITAILCLTAVLVLFAVLAVIFNLRSQGW